MDKCNSRKPEEGVEGGGRTGRTSEEEEKGSAREGWEHARGSQGAEAYDGPLQ